MPSPRFHGWKTRLFHLSHNPSFLIRVTASLLIGGFLAAVAIVWAKGTNTQDVNTLATRFFQKRLDAASTSASPSRALAGWLSDVTRGANPTVADEEEDDDEEEELPKPKPAPKPSLQPNFAAAKPWNHFDFKTIIRQRVPDQATQSLFDDYVTARLHRSEPAGAEARKRLEAAAKATPAPPFANEFVGDMLKTEGQSKEAAQAYRTEGTFPDAERARRLAFNLTVELKDTSALRELLAIPTYLRDASPYDLNRCAILLGDWLLSARSYLRMETDHAFSIGTVFTLLAGLLWYAVFVRFGERDRWRWLRPLTAVLAGVISVWPTMILIHIQTVQLGKHETGEFLNDLVFYVTGVGLREEAAKLALFALFIPWLLKRRAPGQALLTGAFVGLGFALEENLGYFNPYGLGGVAVGRFLTANFFHAAATGLTGFALYELARTRFGKAEQFIGTFVAVVVVHGLYDWVLGAGSSLATLGSISMFSIIILALLARQFFETVETFNLPKRGMVSLLSVFNIGLAVLIASGFIMAALQTGTMAAVSKVGIEAVSLVPIAVFYARKFAHL